MKKSIFILSLLLISILLSACSSLGATGKGTSPEIDFDGTIVSLGKTKLSELYDAGFEKSTVFFGFNDSTIKESSLSIESYYLSKNKKEYGSVALLNKETSVSSLKDCIIHTVYYTIYVDGVSEEETIERSVILINGTDYKGYTSDQVEEAMNGTELIDKSEKTLVYQDGDFITTFSIGDRGTVSSVKLKMDIKTKFVIE